MYEHTVSESVLLVLDTACGWCLLQTAKKEPDISDNSEHHVVGVVVLYDSNDLNVDIHQAHLPEVCS